MLLINKRFRTITLQHECPAVGRSRKPVAISWWRYPEQATAIQVRLGHLPPAKPAPAPPGRRKWPSLAGLVYATNWSNNITRLLVFVFIDFAHASTTNKFEVNKWRALTTTNLAHNLSETRSAALSRNSPSGGSSALVETSLPSSSSVLSEM